MCLSDVQRELHRIGGLVSEQRLPGIGERTVPSVRQVAGRHHGVAIVSMLRAVPRNVAQSVSSPLHTAYTSAAQTVRRRAAYTTRPRATRWLPRVDFSDSGAHEFDHLIESERAGAIAGQGFTNVLE